MLRLVSLGSRRAGHAELNLGLNEGVIVVEFSDIGMLWRGPCVSLAKATVWVSGMCLGAPGKKRSQI